MTSAPSDEGMAGLYRLPLDEFTSARNALAKTAGGAAGAAIKALVKPPLAAWATNQLYWRRRDVYDELIQASTEMRLAHAAVLGGREADPRAAGRRHEEATDAALRATLAILDDDGHPATDATRQAISTTLRALPAPGVEAGRLDRVLQPGGFEMLAGMTVAAATGDSGRAPASKPAPVAPVPARSGGGTQVDRAMAAARAAAAEAQRELRAAEHAVEREAFKASRAAREAERADRAVRAAEEALKEAADALETAKHTSAAAERAREAADSDVQAAGRRVNAARAASSQAEAALKKVTRGR